MDLLLGNPHEVLRLVAQVVLRVLLGVQRLVDLPGALLLERVRGVASKRADRGSIGGSELLERAPCGHRIEGGDEEPVCRTYIYVCIRARARGLE